jgi:hypothetical protein
MSMVHFGHRPNLQLPIRSNKTKCKSVEKQYNCCKNAPRRIQMGAGIFGSTFADSLLARHAKRVRFSLTRSAVLKTTTRTYARAPTLRVWYSAIKKLALDGFRWHRTHSPATGRETRESRQLLGHSPVQLHWILYYLGDVQWREWLVAFGASSIEGIAMQRIQAVRFKGVRRVAFFKTVKQPSTRGVQDTTA